MAGAVQEAARMPASKTLCSHNSRMPASKTLCSHSVYSLDLWHKCGFQLQCALHTLFAHQAPDCRGHKRKLRTLLFRERQNRDPSLVTRTPRTRSSSSSSSGGSGAARKRAPAGAKSKQPTREQIFKGKQCDAHKGAKSLAVIKHTHRSPVRILAAWRRPDQICGDVGHVAWHDHFPFLKREVQRKERCRGERGAEEALFGCRHHHYHQYHHHRQRAHSSAECPLLSACICFWSMLPCLVKTGSPVCMCVHARALCAKEAGPAAVAGEVPTASTRATAYCMQLVSCHCAPVRRSLAISSR
eukprot:1158209-Pelagomonas_calceolata.AAC.8